MALVLLSGDPFPRGPGSWPESPLGVCGIFLHTGFSPPGNRKMASQRFE